MDDKPSHDPIFPPGIHDITVEDLSNHFLKEFQGSATRPRLIEGLLRFLRALAGQGVPCEVWVDGSFSTKKESPADVDLVVFMPAAQIDRLAQDQRGAFMMLFDETYTKQTFGCHTFLARSEDEWYRGSWRGWFGFDRLERPKGIPRLQIVP